jgi:hypothetical protein
MCFTICLFISPDLDGHRAPKNGSLTLRGRHISSLLGSSTARWLPLGTRALITAVLLLVESIFRLVLIFFPREVRHIYRYRRAKVMNQFKAFLTGMKGGALCSCDCETGDIKVGNAGFGVLGLGC